MVLLDKEFIKENFGKHFANIELLIDEFRENQNDNPSAVRAASVALTNLQTAQMWINKAIYSESKEEK